MKKRKIIAIIISALLLSGVITIVAITIVKNKKEQAYLEEMNARDKYYKEQARQRKEHEKFLINHFNMNTTYVMSCDPSDISGCHYLVDYSCTPNQSYPLSYLRVRIKDGKSVKIETPPFVTLDGDRLSYLNRWMSVQSVEYESDNVIAFKCQGCIIRFFCTHMGKKDYPFGCGISMGNYGILSKDYSHIMNNRLIQQLNHGSGQ